MVGGDHDLAKRGTVDARIDGPQTTGRWRNWTLGPFTRLFLTVLLAHLLGDFPLQSSSLVRGKQHGIRAYVAHGAAHLVVLVVCVGVFVNLGLVRSLSFWVAVSLYIAAHLGIDRVKQGLVSIKKLPDSASVFLVDQGVHVCTIVALAWLLIRPDWAALKSQFSWSAAAEEKVLEAGIVYVTVVFAGGYLIRYLTRNLTAGIRKSGETAEEVENAGMYIG